MAQRLMAEINRTAGRGPAGPGGPAPERIYLFGGPGEHRRWPDLIEAELTTPLTVLDPFAGVDAAGVEVPEQRRAVRGAAGHGPGRGRRPARHGLPASQAAAAAGPSRRRAVLAAAAPWPCWRPSAAIVYWDTLAGLQDANQQLSQQRQTSWTRR